MIAISYRREDSTPVAGRLHDRLQAEFGKESVFMDFDSIPYGVDFRDHIAQTLEAADVLVAVIGPGWLGQRVGESTRRIDDTTDFVRLEIAGALQRGIPVIPVLVGKTLMPIEDTLPTDLKPLVFRNALMLDTGIDFHHHADRLIKGIRSLLKSGQSASRRGSKERSRGSSGFTRDSDHRRAAASRFKWFGVLDRSRSPAPSQQQDDERGIKPTSLASTAEPVTAVPKETSAQSGGTEAGARETALSETSQLIEKDPDLERYGGSANERSAKQLAGSHPELAPPPVTAPTVSNQESSIPPFFPPTTPEKISEQPGWACETALPQTSQLTESGLDFEPHGVGSSDRTEKQSAPSQPQDQECGDKPTSLISAGESVTAALKPASAQPGGTGAGASDALAETTQISEGDLDFERYSGGRSDRPTKHSAPSQRQDHERDAKSISLAPVAESVTAAPRETSAQSGGTESGADETALSETGSLIERDRHFGRYAILFAVALLALGLWYVAAHKPQSAKQVAIPSGSNGPSVESATTPPLVAKSSVEPMSPLPSASVQPKLIPKQSSRLEVTVSVGSTVYSVAFSPDGTRIVTGSYDHTAKVWDAQGGEELLTLKGHSDRADSVAFSPDGRRIVTGSTDRTARVWDAQSGKELLALNVGSTVNSVAFSPNGMRIVTGGDDATARVWDAQGGKELLMLNVGSTVNSVAFSPDGSRVATGSGDATAKVWDAQSGKELLTLKGHFYSVNSVTFSPDGTRVVSGSLDGTAKLWDVHSGQALLTFSFGGQVNSVAFSPDGSRISTGGDGSTAKVWDAQSGKELLTLKERSSGVNSVAFSPDGTRIVTGNLDGTAKVWGFGDTASKLAPTVKPSVSIAPSVEPLSPSPVASVQPKAVVEQRSQRPTKPTTLDFASITKEQPYVNSLGMKFVPVPGTNVLFSVWDTRVKDYKVFAEATKREWPKLGFKQTDEHPAVNVTWNDAKAFCMWLTNTERAAGRISDQQDYRLPTDGEWSAAVGKTKYPWGDQWPPPREAGNYGSSLHIDDYKFTSPVGAFAPNAAGLYDVGGNVWQWCEDWYAKQMNEKAILDKHRDLRDDGGGHTQHLVRGASWWVSDATYMLSSTRMGGGSPNYRNANNGFRCVLSESTIPSRTEDKSSSPAESLSSSAPPNDTGASEATPIPSPSSQIATSPPAPEQTALAKNGRTWQAWIGDFVRQFVAADQLNDANATLALYAATVDYFDDHQADQAFIRQDIEKSNERWPVRRDSIEGDIHLQEKVPDKEYVASFKRNRYAESAPHALWTKGQLAIDLDITVTDGIPKISGIKAKMLHQEKGKPTPVTSNSPTPANLPRRSAYGIPVPGKPGLVKSPYAPSKGLVDVRRYRKGAEVKCPFTGKIFVVP